jgi:prepilin-type N-terminal cleavage/methylation domain-containing protein
MNWTRRLRRPSPRANGEGGFTMIELMIALVVLALIGGALAAAFVTSMTASTNNTQMVHASNDAQLIAAYLVRDAQSAGGTNAFTGLVDPSLGVSINLGTSDPDAAVAGCHETSPPDQLLIRFAWRDYVDSDTSHLHLAKYYYVPPSGGTAGQIVRLTCVDSTRESEQTLGSHVGTPGPVAACVPSSACPGLPNLVQLTVNEVANTLTPASPYTYTLSANVRASSDVSLSPGGNPPAQVPVLALGGTTCVSPGNASGYGDGGNSTTRVYGGVVVNDGGAACAPINFFGNSYTYTAAGTPQVLNIPDPYASLTPPSQPCTPGVGSNPAPVGGVYPSGVYPQPLPAGATLATGGIFVLCNNVPTGLTGTGVLLYLEQGAAINWNANSTTTLSAGSTGPYAGIAIWQDKTNTSPFIINGGAALTLGIAAPGMGSGIYAPGAPVELIGNADVSIGWVVAQAVVVSGNHSVTIGVPPTTAPQIDAIPATLPNGLVGHPYPNTQITATGGSGGNLWTGTGLDGLTIDPNAGLISGTPAAAGTFTATITVTDNLGDVSQRAYPLTINALPTVTSTNPNSRGQGATNQNVTINGTGFVNGAVASFSGTGISVNSTTWVSATRLTASITVAANAPTGVRDVTVTNPDTGVGTATGVFTVNAAPAVTATNPNPRGQGATNQNITITGTGFVNGAVASFSGTGITVNSTTWVSATQLTANIDIAGSAPTGVRDVTVTNPDKGVGTGTSVFAVTGGPTVTTINPATHTKNANGIVVIITGTGFVNGAGVTLNATSGTAPTITNTTWNSSTQITITINIPNKTSTDDLVVTNPDGGAFALVSGFTAT